MLKQVIKLCSYQFVTSYDLIVSIYITTRFCITTPASYSACINFEFRLLHTVLSFLEDFQSNAEVATTAVFTLSPFGAAYFTHSAPYNQRTPWNRVLENLIVTQLVKKFATFYGTQSSLPCSQEPTTEPYPESNESS
jgi:hypothetical protein